MKESNFVPLKKKEGIRVRLCGRSLYCVSVTIFESSKPHKPMIWNSMAYDVVSSSQANQNAITTACKIQYIIYVVACDNWQTTTCFDLRISWALFYISFSSKDTAFKLRHIIKDKKEKEK